MSYATGPLDNYLDAAIADLDGDGRFDLALGKAEKELDIIRGAARDGFPSASPRLPTGVGPRSAVTIDADGDSRRDIVARGTLGLSLLRGQAGRAFGVPEDVPGLTGLQGLAAADLDADGREELLASDVAQGALVVVRFGVAGPRLEVTRLRSAPGAVVPLDWNEDGAIDAAVADLIDPVVSLVLVAGDDDSRVVEYQVGDPGTALAAGDLDADGHIDLAVSTRAGLQLVPGNGPAGNRVRFPEPAAARSLQAADLDRDLRLDLLAVSTTGSRLEAFLRPDSPSTAVLSLAEGGERRDAIARDLDLDGHLDVLSSVAAPIPSLELLPSLGPLRFAVGERYRVGRDPWGISAADLDGDGAEDAIVACLDARFVQVLWRDPGPAGAWFSRGDADGDGRLGLADAVVTLAGLFLGAALPDCRDAVDANDDGRLDLADAMTTLSHLFQGASALPPPFPEAGKDPTPDDLGCPAMEVNR